MFILAPVFSLSYVSSRRLAQFRYNETIESLNSTPEV